MKRTCLYIDEKGRISKERITCQVVGEMKDETKIWAKEEYDYDTQYLLIKMRRLNLETSAITKLYMFKII